MSQTKHKKGRGYWFDKAQEIARLGIWEQDYESGELWWSDQTFNIFGLKPQQFKMTMDRFLTYVQADDRETILLETQKLFESNGQHPYKVEYRITCPDGEEKFIREFADIAEEEPGGKKNIFGIVLDISSEKREELEVRKREAHFKKLFQKAPLGYQSLNIDGEFIDVNPAWLDMLGYSREEVIGHEFQEFLVEDGFVEKTLPRFKEAGEIQLPMTAMRCKDGSIKIVHIDGRIGYDEEEDFLQTHCILTDVTEREEMEKALRQSQKMDALGNLAGGIAHEINNMLLPIITLSEMTIKDLPEGSKEQKRLERVVEAGVKARDLIAGILAFSYRKDGGVNKEVFNFTDLIQETLELLRSTLPSTITVTDNLAPRTGAVLCDPSQISTILMNMGSNAVDAMEGHVGELAISVTQTEVTEELSQKITNLKPGRFAKLTVSDTGSGMDAETTNRLFDPFFTTKEVGEGKGLGLAMAHGIITKHGGAIDVSSEIGVGTTFDIYLPLVEQEK